MTPRLDPSLRDDLVREFCCGLGESWADDRFAALALRVFEMQYESCGVLRRFWEQRDARPQTVAGWEAIPPVPTSAFKSVRLAPDDAGPAERIFRTSGTTRGEGERGEHHVLDLGLYEAALLSHFRDRLLPDGARPRLIALMPDPETYPESSLSYMMGAVARELLPDSRWVADVERGIDGIGFAQALEESVREGRPVLIAATAFALVHALEVIEKRGPVVLPAGSRLMETGGFKGRSREVSRELLYATVERSLGIEPTWVVNEYGMTEMLSQFYEPVLAEPTARRRHVPPPWVRTRVLDPVSLDPVSAGQVGVLCHFDLANLYSVAPVLTEDLGFALGDGFVLQGRAPAAELRGCSLTMEDFMRAAGTS